MQKKRIFNTMPIMSSRPIVSPHTHSHTRIIFRERERKCICDLSSRYFCSAKVHIADHELRYSNLYLLQYNPSSVCAFLNNCHRAVENGGWQQIVFFSFRALFIAIDNDLTTSSSFKNVLQSFGSSWLIQGSGEQLDLLLSFYWVFHRFWTR